MTAFTRAAFVFAAIVTSALVFVPTASADAKSDCYEARAFLRSETARTTCSSRYRSARTLFCTSPTSQRLLSSMARSCKARAAAPSSSSSSSAPATKPEGGAASVDDIPACKAHFAHILSCPPSKSLPREEEVRLRKKGWQEMLNAGKRVEIISGACQIADKAYKC